MTNWCAFNEVSDDGLNSGKIDTISRIELYGLWIGWCTFCTLVVIGNVEMHVGSCMFCEYVVDGNDGCMQFVVIVGHGVETVGTNSEGVNARFAYLVVPQYLAIH